MTEIEIDSDLSYAAQLDAQADAVKTACSDFLKLALRARVESYRDLLDAVVRLAPSLTVVEKAELARAILRAPDPVSPF